MRTPDPRASRALRRLGTNVGARYALVRLIGIGGMATVYEATDREGDASVAVKLLHDTLSADPHVERLFRREARLANTIGHPGVVPVIDHGVGDDGCIFLVMPLLRGETLRDRVARAGGKLPHEEVVFIGHAVLEALAAAHAAKIVHRDLKPANIFVTREGEIRVLDFGIARFFDADATATATASGIVLGTPAFMAPEQALGRTRLVDGRSDLWGLGATLFTLLSGRFVHDAEGAGELAVLAATKPAQPLAEIAPEAHAALCAVIDRALAFEQSARWPDAQTMDTALLAACVAAFGKPVTKLAKLDVPEAAQSSDDDSEATRPPNLAFDPASASRDRSAQAFAHTELRAIPGRKRRRVVTGIAAAVLVAAAAIPLARSRLHPATPAQAPDAEANARAANDLASPGSAAVAEDALVDYRAGIQLWRDASLPDAIEKLGAATAKAPTFAAAHLWLVMVTAYATPASRAHYADAATYRSTLDEAQVELLDAYGPAMSDPPDYATTASRLGVVAQHHPDSVEIPAARARLLARMADPVGAAAALATVPGDASSLGIVLLLRASFATLEADPAHELALLAECVQRSPRSTTCLNLLWQLDASEGRCAEIEPVCRKLMAGAPASPEGYRCLADALVSTGSTPDEVRAAYAEAYKRMDPTDVPLARTEDDTWLAVAAGHLDEATALAKTWVDLAASSGASAHARASSYEAYVALALETGRRDTAVHAAREFVTQSRSWPRMSTLDFDATGIFLRSETGDLDASTRGQLRARVIAATEEPSYGTPTRRWYNGYAATSWTRDEALEAVAHVPSPLPPTGASDDDYLFARVFALAGDEPRASALFTRAARSCSVRDDFYRTKAKLEWAIRSETRPAEACTLFGDIASHWPVKTKSVTSLAAQKRGWVLGCSFDKAGAQTITTQSPVTH